MEWTIGSVVGEAILLELAPMITALVMTGKIGKIAPDKKKKSSPLVYFPARETVLDSETAPDPEITGYRLQALQQLRTHEKNIGIVATCIQA